MCLFLFFLQGVQGISDIITIPGLVNVDFADVKAIMQVKRASLVWGSAYRDAMRCSAVQHAELAGWLASNLWPQRKAPS